MCADDYAAAVCAIKSTQLIKAEQPVAFSSTQEQYPSLFGKQFNLCRSQNDVQNKKTFSQQTIHAQIKDQPHGSDRTHFDIGFNNGNVAMHRQTIIFLLSHKIATFQQKTKHNKHEKPSHQSIAKSITKNHNKQPTQPLNQNHPKTTTTSSYEKMQCF